MVSDKLYIKEWDWSKNDADPFTIGHWNATKVWWKCNICFHEWMTTPGNRALGTGCPVCANAKKGPKGRLFIDAHSLLVKELHPTKNTIDYTKLSSSSPTNMWWICDKGHEWEANIYNRGYLKNGCPYCKGILVCDESRLAIQNPSLYRELHPTKNKDIDTYALKERHHLKAWWVCDKGHTWYTSVSHRANGHGCRICHNRSSKIELLIYESLKDIFPSTISQAKIDKMEVDIYIPEINIGVEYDGAYWHKDRVEKDKIKTKKLEMLGIGMIRVREKGLPFITENDIYSENSNKPKNEVKDILDEIKKMRILTL